MQLQGLEAFFFYALAFAAIVTGVFTVSARSAVHSALFLISTMVSIAGLFLLLRAEFIMGVQILVYVGGVMVLFLFVVMLVNQRDEPIDIYSRQYWPAMLVVALLGLGLVASIFQTQTTGFFKFKPAAEQTTTEVKDASAPSGTISADTQALGGQLYTRAVLPFEVASVLLLVAIVGAVLLAREKKQEQLYD